MKRRKHIFASLVLLTLFVTYQVSITAFTHVHLVKGVMIVHSHPSPNKQHTHTAGQVISIAHLSAIQTLEAGEAIAITVECPVLYLLEYQINTFRAKAPHTQCVQLRAPPFYC